MNILIGALIFIALFTGVYLGADKLGGVSAITTQFNNVSTFISAAVGNMKNMSSFFPLLDLVLAFTALLVTEGIILFLKIIKFFIGMMVSAAKK